MKKILIVEDEKDMVTGLKFNLEARDYTVITAYDGEAGCQKALISAEHEIHGADQKDVFPGQLQH